jgi:hypothetical protein
LVLPGRDFGWRTDSGRVRGTSRTAAVALAREGSKARRNQDDNRVNDYLQFFPKLEIHEGRFYAKVERGDRQKCLRESIFLLFD